MNSKIYFGEVMHTRVVPVKHSFRYPVYFYAFELDELPELARSNPLFGYNQLRPVAIHDRDYLLPGSQTIKDKVKSVLSKAGFENELGRVILVTAARYFNYIFNPISFFYCHDREDKLACILAQVNNTFGEMHLYPLMTEESKSVDGRLRFCTDKQFHVSPFFPRQGQYEFRLTPFDEKIDNTIRYHLNDQLALVARMFGSAVPLTTSSLAKAVIANPVCASLTMPRILWQAARLHWQRRLPVYEKPVPDNDLTIRPVPPSMIDRIGMNMVIGFLDRLPEGDLSLTTPDRKKMHFGQPGTQPSLELTIREYRFFRRVMVSGDTGFGEAYTDGDWSTSDLPGLLTLLASNEAVMDDRSIITSAIGRAINYLRHLRRPNTIRGSDRNIREHYDLSNEFFATFLDPTMTYSCALFNGPGDTLEQAQRNKLRTIIDKAGIAAEHHVLEIGCGWGSFAIEAVRQTGCRVTGITISREQLELAQQRVAAAGLQERIELRLCDYRHIDGRYDKIVSIEMLEAVGHAGLRPFFKACHDALLPGGSAVIQVITIPDRKYNAYRYSSDWIRKHIFPGGHLPSMGAMKTAVSQTSDLRLDDVQGYAADYATTLQRWRQTLLEKQQEIKTMGFDDAFIRKWEYYFAYCHAGFRAEIIDLVQMVLNKPE